MHTARRKGHQRFLLCMAALALLAALLLSPGEVRGQTAPMFDDGETATRTVPENSPTGTNVGTPVAATDDDDDSLTYALSGTDASSFDFDTNTGQIKTMSGVTYDFEADKNSYTVTVTVEDDEDPKNSDTIEVTITVTDVDEVGTVTITEILNAANELEAGGELEASLTDPDATVENLTWQWSSNATADGPFSDISGATNAKYTSVAADVGKYLKATATYTDKYSADSNDTKSAENVTSVVIVASNAEPSFPSSETGTRSVDENTEPNVNIGSPVSATDSDTDASLTYGLTGTDAALFEISSSDGQLKTKSALDHEDEASRTVIVTVRDSKDAAGDADTMEDNRITVTITVNDVNEPPDITTDAATDEARSFAEIEFDVDTTTLTAMDRLVHTYAAADPDDGANLTWTLSGIDKDNFNIGPSDGKLRFKLSQLPDFENPNDVEDPMTMMGAEDNVYKIVVEVKDSIDDSGNADDAVDDEIEVTVTVTDVNEAPTITTTDTTRSVQENTTAVLTFEATDVDNNSESNDSANTLTWSVEDDDDGGKFSINSSGDLAFSSAPDFEDPQQTGSTDNEYTVTVKVTDNGIHDERASTNHKSDTHEITVTVTNVNEAPAITTTQTTHTAPSKMEIEYDDTSPDLSVVTYAATDPDTQTGNTLTWTLEGDDFADFDIDSSTGVLSFKDPPNFEIPTGTPATPGDDPDNTYEITVKVTDNGIPTERDMATWLDATQDVVVTVTDVNERPDIDEVTNDGFEYAEVDFYYTQPPDAVHTFTATDYDGDGFTWSLDGADEGDFVIDSATGELTFVQVTSLNVGPLPSFEDP